MARIRTIKPEFPQSESMGRVSREARLCFILLWTLSDDAGRLRGNSRMLASLLYPYDDDAKELIDSWLDELASEGCISRYEVDNSTYIQITAWTEHQKIDRPSASKLPEFAQNSRNLAKPRETSFTPAEKKPRKGREGKGEEGGEDSRADILAKSPPTPPADELLPTEPPVVSIPLNNNTEFLVTQPMVDEWVLAYPAVDVLQELREMRSWSTANPSQRKTTRGVQSFICRWLGREQDRGGGRLVPGSHKEEIGVFL